MAPLVATCLLVVAPAAHAAGEISDVALAVSNNATGATGVTYTWNFTTGSALAAGATIQLSVPAATAGTPAIGSVYGLVGCTVASPALSAGTISLSLSGTGCAPAAATPVSIALTGLTNPDAATADFASTVTIGSENGTATGAVDFNDNTTTVNVIVPESLTFENPATSITLLPIPGSDAAATADVDLAVSTNAAGGYTLAACVTDPIETAGGEAIAQLTGAQDLATAVGFGGHVTVDSNSGLGTAGTGIATVTGDWGSTGSTYVGYQSSCTDPTAQILSSDGSTNGDSITLTNAVRVEAVQASGTYTGTITYQVTPSY